MKILENMDGENGRGNNCETRVCSRQGRKLERAKEKGEGGKEGGEEGREGIKGSRVQGKKEKK